MKHVFYLKNLIIIAAVLLWNSPTHAESTLTPQYQKCLDNVDLGAMKNTQWATCTEEEIKRQDVILNAEYRTLMTYLSSGQRRALVTAQRSWLKFREDWCQFEKLGNTAPGGYANYSFCFLDMTVEQIKKIKSNQH